MLRLLLILSLLAAPISPQTVIVAKKAGPSGIAFRSVSHISGGFSGTSFTVDKPAGTANGDVLLLYVASDSDFTYSNNAGFTQIHYGNYAGGALSIACKVAGGSEPATYAPTFAATEMGVVSMLAYSGAAGCPASAVAEQGTPGAGVPHTTAFTLPTADNAMLVGAIYIDPAGLTACTEVPGYPLRISTARNANAGLCVADKLQTTAASAGVQLIEDVGGTWGETTLYLLRP